MNMEHQAVIINTEKCIGCGLCSKVCPAHNICLLYTSFLLGDSLSPGNGDLLNIAINAQKTFSLVFTSGETKNMPSPIYAYSIGFSIKRSVSEVYIFLFSRTNNKIATNVWIDGLGWTGWSER